MKTRTPKQLQAEIERLSRRLEESEETIRAIRNGEVDAVVVHGPSGDQVYTLKGTDHSYRVLVEQMGEGTATLTEQGIIYYCNNRLAEILKVPLEKLMGSLFLDYATADDRPALEGLLRQGAKGRSEGDLMLCSQNSRLIPVHISVQFVPLDEGHSVVVVTDLTERQRAEERLRHLTGQIVNLVEEERRRVSRELHDQTGQALTVLRMSLESIRCEQPGEWQLVCARLGDAIDLIGETIDQVRALAQDLRPPSLDQVGLNDSLEGFCRDFARRTRLPIAYTHAEINSIPEPIAVTFYRFLQEALTNVARHAQATTVSVDLNLVHDAVVLTVQDDGKGFDVGAVTAAGFERQGLGLLGMQERLRLHSGKLKIESQPGLGTRLVARIPLHQIANRD